MDQTNLLIRISLATFNYYCVAKVWYTRRKKKVGGAADMLETADSRDGNDAKQYVKTSVVMECLMQ